MRRSHVVVNDAFARWGDLDCQLGWFVLSYRPPPSRELCGGAGRRKATLRPFVRARYRSLLFFVLLGSSSLRSISPSEVPPAFNECHPGCPPGVYFYDASEIRLTLVDDDDDGGRTKTARSGDYDRRISSFMSTLPALQLLDLSFLSFFFTRKFLDWSPQREWH